MTTFGLVSLIGGFYLWSTSLESPHPIPLPAPSKSNPLPPPPDWPQITPAPWVAPQSPSTATPPHAPVSTGFAVDSNASKPSPQDIPVPFGAQVPAVLMDGGGPDDSPETADIMNSILEEFAEKITAAKLANRNEHEAWEEAREAADDRYRQFFGFEAFNEATRETAGEAFDESSAQQQPPSR